MTNKTLACFGVPKGRTDTICIPNGHILDRGLEGVPNHTVATV